VSGRRGWLAALYAAGVTPASFLPDASQGRVDDHDDEMESGRNVELVEDAELRVHPVEAVQSVAPIAFLDGIQQWKVVGYDGVAPIAIAYVAAAVRRRGPDRRLTTAHRTAGELVVGPSWALAPERCRAIEAAGLRVVAVEDAPKSQPGRLLEVIRREVHRARQGAERLVGEQALSAMGPDEWLAVDGQLGVSAALARHPRTMGVIKTHGAQFLEGRHLERALTLPASHRTSVFRVHGGHGRTVVDSWYLRLWPWEGNDLLYGLLRIETRVDVDMTRRAAGISSWLLGERAPLAARDARRDRLLYPIHDVETYLRSTAPRDLLSSSGSRVPRTGS